MEVDKSASDVPMPTAPASVAASDGSPPKLIEVTGFGPHVIGALNDFINTLSKHAVHRKMSIPKAWPPSLRAKKTAEMKQAWDDDITKLVDACFFDRNIRYRDAEPSPSGGCSTLTTLVESEQSTTSSPEASKCACAAIHASILTCPAGQGHRALCETILKKSNQSKKKLVYTEAPEAQAKQRADRSRSPIPSTSGTRQGRRGRREQGRGNGNKRKNHSSVRSKSPPRKEARGRGGRDHRYYQDKRDSSSGSAPPAATSTTSPGKDTIPSAAQFKSLMSKAVRSFDTSTDIRLRTPGHGLQEATIPSTSEFLATTKTPSTASTGQAQVGDSCYRADGKVDWGRIPRRPKDLPADLKFDVHPRGGVWMVDLGQ